MASDMRVLMQKTHSKRRCQPRRRSEQRKELCIAFQARNTSKAVAHPARCQLGVTLET